MTNDLARGENYYSNKKEKITIIILQFIKKIFDRTDKLEGIYFRASVPSPALSHWLIDDLIPYLSARRIFKNIKFLYNEELVEYQKYHLKIFNIKENDIYITDKTKKYIVEELILVDKEYNIDPIFSFSSIQDHALKKIIEKIVNNNIIKSSNKKIYVSRKDSTRSRILINENEIEQYLISKGYEIIVGSDYSGFELLNIYANAEIVVGPLGAGLLNTIFSLGEVRVIALTSPNYYEAHLAQISFLKNNSYEYIIGEEIPSPDIIEGGLRNSNYYIPLELIQDIK
jgi:capsular polysaccharide biosynthesis protein